MEMKTQYAKFYRTQLKKRLGLPSGSVVKTPTAEQEMRV